MTNVRRIADPTPSKRQSVNQQLESPPMQNYYRRHLPHYQPLGEVYHTTFRLAGSLPVKLLERLRREKQELQRRLLLAETPMQRLTILRQYDTEHFYNLDAALNRSGRGPHWLRETEIAEIVVDTIRFRDGTIYDLYAYCIMPNHVHLVFKLPCEDGKSPGERGCSNSEEGDQIGSHHPVTGILGSLKKHSSLEANRKLDRRGAFWKGESYDHVVRDGKELERVLWYVLMNPVKAGLVKSWQDWKWSYCKPGLLSL
jgi:putative transposase